MSGRLSTNSGKRLSTTSEKEQKTVNQNQEKTQMRCSVAALQLNNLYFKNAKSEFYIYIYNIIYYIYKYKHKFGGKI